MPRLELPSRPTTYLTVSGSSADRPSDAGPAKPLLRVCFLRGRSPVTEPAEKPSARAAFPAARARISGNDPRPGLGCGNQHFPVAGGFAAPLSPAAGTAADHRFGVLLFDRLCDCRALCTGGPECLRIRWNAGSRTFSHKLLTAFKCGSVYPAARSGLAASRLPEPD